MPSPIRRDITPLAPRLSTPPKTLAARSAGTLLPGNRPLSASTQPASQAAAKLTLREGSASIRTSGQAATALRKLTDITVGRNGALAALRGESTFESAVKPLNSAVKTLGADVSNLGPTSHDGPTSTNAVSEPPSDPNQRAGWWNSLTPEQQSQQIAADPQKIGSLDGLPAAARDRANREQLQQDITRLEAEAEDAKAAYLQQNANTPYGQQAAHEPAENFLPEEKKLQLQNAHAVQEQLNRVEESTDPVTHEPVTAQLLVYEPSFAHGEGRAAIAVGNVDTADNVAVSVPGLDSNVRDYMDNLTGNALSLYNESRKAGGDVATIAWMGYDAPGFSNVASDNAAEHGAELLASDVDAIRASRGGDQPHLTVIGHSYGSTTASIAADKNGLAADDLVLIGSPGAGSADNVSDYNNIDKEHVWVGSASRDPVTYFNDTATLGTWDPLGLDPALDSFGANRFQAESVNREDGGFGNFDNHSRYYDEDSESLYNMASIVTGHYNRVLGAESRDESFLVVDDPEADRNPHKVDY